MGKVEGGDFGGLLSGVAAAAPGKPVREERAVEQQII